MAVHADGPAPAAEVAVGLLLQEQEVEAVADRLGVLAVGLGVAGAEVGQQRQAGQCGVGLPVDALAEAGLAGRAVDRVVVVALDGRAVVVLGGRAVPAAVGVLVAGEPVERALDGLLAGRAGAGALSEGRAVGVEPRTVDRRDVVQRRPPVVPWTSGSRGVLPGMTRISAMGPAGSLARRSTPRSVAVSVTVSGRERRRTSASGSAGSGGGAAAGGLTTSGVARGSTGSTATVVSVRGGGRSSVRLESAAAPRGSAATASGGARSGAIRGPAGGGPARLGLRSRCGLTLGTGVARLGRCGAQSRARPCSG